MNDREELIEKAAKAMVRRVPGETWEDCEQAWYLADAEAALAVFEESQKPTDDEREALEARAWGDQYRPGMSQKEAAAFKRGHAAGWRDGRPMGAETGVHRCEECQTCGAHGSEHLRCCGCYDGVCCQELEPQGEPSGAQVEAAADAIRWASEHGGWESMARAALRAAGGVR